LELERGTATSFCNDPRVKPGCLSPSVRLSGGGRGYEPLSDFAIGVAPFIFLGVTVCEVEVEVETCNFWRFLDISACGGLSEVSGPSPSVCVVSSDDWGVAIVLVVMVVGKAVVVGCCCC
jgi:hypothetical protein